MSKKVDEVLGDVAGFKKLGISPRALFIGLSVVAVLAILPMIFGNPRQKTSYDESIYTAKAVNFNTEQVIAVGEYSQLLSEYMGSHGVGFPGTTEGKSFWETEITFAPFLSVVVDDFLSGTREELVQVQFLSLLVQWQELNTVLDAGLEFPDNYVDFNDQLQKMEFQVFEGEKETAYWEIPEDLILEKPADAGYHAMMWYRTVVADTEVIGSTDEIMFLHQYGGSPELTEWAFAEDAKPGDRAIINTLYGDIEVLLYGYVSTEDVEKYIESRKVVGDVKLNQYYDRLKQWALVSS